MTGTVGGNELEELMSQEIRYPFQELNSSQCIRSCRCPPFQQSNPSQSQIAFTLVIAIMGKFQIRLIMDRIESKLKSNPVRDDGKQLPRWSLL